MRIVGWLVGRRTRWAVVLIWVALAAALAVSLPAVSHVESPNPANLPTSASSVAAGRIQNQAFGSHHSSPGILVFYRRGGLTGSDLTTVASVLKDLQTHRLPLQTGKVPFVHLRAGQLSRITARHGSTLVVPLSFEPNTSGTQLSAIKQDLGTDSARAAGHNLLTVPTNSGTLSARLTGPEGIAIDTAGLFKNADVALLASTTMLILVLLLIIYRSPVLPWVPLVSVGVSYVVTSGILAALAGAHAIVVDAETVSIMTVLMFGVGTDYTLFVVSRYRTQLQTEANHVSALGAAYGRVFKAVAVSAATVMLALLTLLVSHYGSDYRFAIPFAVGVGITALSSLTLVPAILSILGRPAFWPFPPNPGRNAPPARARLALWVTKRPWVTAVTVTIVLGALALNSTRIHTTFNLLSELPTSAQSVQGYSLLSRAEGSGALAPVSVVVTGPGAAKRIQSSLAQVGAVRSVSVPRLGTFHHQPVAVYSVDLRVNPLSNRAIAALPAIQNAAQKALGPNGTPVHLGGSTAQNRDSRAAIGHDTRWVIPLVLALIAVLLLIYLRSIVAAAYLLMTVVLSFFAALGAGWILLHNILGISGWAGGVTLYAFVFLVALGEDYNIFIMSAIWEGRQHQPMLSSIRWGMRQSGPVITAAGLILAGTFAVLTGLPLRILLEFGVVAAIGVLLDTFLVRSLLVPAITTLLKDKAFWPSPPPGDSRVRRPD